MEGLGETVSILINEAMKAERSSVLHTQPWERTEHRTGQANGFKNKVVSSRLGRLHLNVPQVRGDVEFYPSALEKGIRIEVCYGRDVYSGSINQKSHLCT